MFKVLRRSAVNLTITLIGASLIAFFLIRWIPGDPVLNLLGERGGSEELVQEIRAKLGFDRSLPEQYFLFVSNALRGDLGVSVVSKRPVLEEFFDRFPATLELSLVSLFLAILVGLPLGILAAVKQKSKWDFGIMTVSLIGYSMPIFWWGLLVILFFSVGMGIFPVGGRIDIVHDMQTVTGYYLIDSWFASENKFELFKSALLHLCLPALVLATVPLAVVARMTRASFLEVLREDFMKTHRSFGVSKTKLIWIFGLRNALIPVVTILGVLAGSLLTGAVLTETIFSWPGVGRWLVKSIEARDYPVVQGGILLTSLAVAAVNLFVDVLCVIINPRMRRST